MHSNPLSFAGIKARCEALGIYALACMDACGVLDDGPLLQLLADGVGDMEFLQRQLELRRNPDLLLPGYRSMLVCALPYQSEMEEQELKRARYAAGRDYHKIFRRKLAQIGQSLLDQDGKACRSRACVDSAPLNERSLAARAGLGWLGRNALLIHPQHGSYHFLGFLLTDAVLEVHDGAAGDDRCGTCTACESSCPTQALSGRRVLSERCISYLTIEHQGVIPRQLASRFQGWWYGCDICQEVCPWNRFAGPAGDGRLCGTDDESTVLAVDENSFEAFVRGRALRRISYAQFRRNLAVALWSLGRLQNFDHEGHELVRAQLQELGTAHAD